MGYRRHISDAERSFAVSFASRISIIGHMTALHKTDQLTTPPADSIAFFVRVQRGFRHWKQETLAAMAGVSLSTVRRVERAETVTPDCLSKIATALGFTADYLTAPRRKLSESEALASLKESVSWMDGLVEVPVAALTKECQIRELAAADMLMVGADFDEAQEDVAALCEWFDLTGFMRATSAGLIGPKPDRSFRLRELYADLFSHVQQMQKQHRAVCLVGTYTAQTDSKKIPTATIAVISIRSKARNPAAAKFNTLWCEQTVSWKTAIEQMS